MPTTVIPTGAQLAAAGSGPLTSAGAAPAGPAGGDTRPMPTVGDPGESTTRTLPIITPPTDGAKQRGTAPPPPPGGSTPPPPPGAPVDAAIPHFDFTNPDTDLAWAEPDGPPRKRGKRLIAVLGAGAAVLILLLIGAVAFGAIGGKDESADSPDARPATVAPTSASPSPSPVHSSAPSAAGQYEAPPPRYDPPSADPSTDDGSGDDDDWRDYWDHRHDDDGDDGGDYDGG